MCRKPNWSQSKTLPLQQTDVNPVETTLGKSADKELFNYIGSYRELYNQVYNSMYDSDTEDNYFAAISS